MWREFSIDHCNSMSIRSAGKETCFKKVFIFRFSLYRLEKRKKHLRFEKVFEWHKFQQIVLACLILACGCLESIVATATPKQNGKYFIFFILYFLCLFIHFYILFMLNNNHAYFESCRVALMHESVCICAGVTSIVSFCRCFWT